MSNDNKSEDARKAKALKQYLESKRMAVPLEIQTLSSGCNEVVDLHQFAGYIAQYLRSHNLWIPNNLYSNCSPIISTSLFDDLWRIYISQYPNQKDFQKQLKDCVVATSLALYSHLIKKDNRPVLLLGNVQSGKTNAFEKIIALCFDAGFDACIVLTKNANKLLDQTKDRIEDDLRRTGVAIPDCYDIADNASSDSIEEDIRNNRKLIIFSKKEINNLNRLTELTLLAGRKILIVDDEADNISVGFYGNKMKPEIAACAKAIEDLRIMLKTYAYLQVTATCFNIILQPVNPIPVYYKKQKIAQKITLSPFCPSEIIILPTYPGYKGVNEFFSNQGKNKYWVTFNSKNITTVTNPITNHCLYRPILEYLIATAVLKLNAKNKPDLKTCSLIHTNVEKADQKTINKITRTICNDIRDNIISPNPSKDFNNYVNDIYADFQLSNLYSRQTVLNAINCNANIKTINSQYQYNSTILKHGANIFIGAYMLDRGLTFDHLISFIYGRTSNQQDTVMQHARFFGDRSDLELKYTRLYMTKEMWNIMTRMHQCDKDLRTLISGTPSGDRWSVLRDKSFKVCAGKKILVSDIMSEKNKAYFTPRGMQIPKDMNSTNNEILTVLGINVNNSNAPQTISGVTIQKAMDALDLIKSTYVYDKTYDNLERVDDIDSLKRVFNLSQHIGGGGWTSVTIVYYPNRDLSRKDRNNEWISAVLTGEKKNSDLSNARNITKQTLNPVLVITKQKGSQDKGWCGHEFFWPALVLPKALTDDLYIISTTN